MIKRLLLCVFLTFSFVLVQAQTSWTLQACIEEALKKNLSVQQAGIGIAYGQNNLLQSKLNLLPSLNGSVGYNFNFGNSVDPTTYEFISDASQSASFSLSSSVNLFSGLQNWYQIQKSQLDLKASVADAQTAADNIALSVTTTFLQIMLAQEALESARSQKQFTDEQVLRTTQLIEAGALPQSNTLDMQAQLAQDEMNLTVAENNLELSVNTMKILLQLPADAAFEISLPQENLKADQLESMNPYSIYNTALQQRSEIQSAILKLESAGKNIRIAQSGLYPRLSFFAQIGSNYFNKARDVQYLTIDNPPIGYLQNDTSQTVLSYTSYTLPISSSPTPFQKQLSNNFSQGIGLSLSVPIFNQWQTRTAILNAKLNYKASELTLTAAENDLRDKVYNAYWQAKAALKTYAAAQKQEAAVKNSYTLGNTQFVAGAISSFDLNQLKNTYFKVQLELLRAKYDYIFKYKLLEVYSGKKWNELF